jgi:hypothetical protein
MHPSLSTIANPRVAQSSNPDYFVLIMRSLFGEYCDQKDEIRWWRFRVLVNIPPHDPFPNILHTLKFSEYDFTLKTDSLGISIQ